MPGLLDVDVQVAGGAAHIVQGGLQRDGVGVDGAAHAGQQLHQNVAHGEPLYAGIAHLGENDLTEYTRQHEHENVGNVEPYHTLNHAVEQDCTLFRHFHAQHEEDDSLKQGVEHRHQQNSDGGQVEEGAEPENHDVDKGQQDNAEDVLGFQLVVSH